MFLEVVTEGHAEWFHVAGVESHGASRRERGLRVVSYWNFMLIDCIVYISMYISEYIVDC
jgi:hypothetical protein